MPEVVNLTMAILQFAGQEVLVPTPGPSPKNWGTGVNLKACFSGAKRPKNKPSYYIPFFITEGRPGGRV
jgi:hypothetical protein